METAYLKHSRTWPLGWALVLVGGNALAAVGQALSPAAQATVWHAPSGLYTAHETTLATGTLVREFASADGLVFAISWRGPVQPDLTTLLGSYFDTFKKASVQARHPGRRGAPLQVAQDGLVVYASGRMPHFFGYAYATSLVPVALNIKDVVQ